MWCVLQLCRMRHRETEYTNLHLTKKRLLCLPFLFLCRVRTEKKSSRKRWRMRGTESPKRKIECATAAVEGIIWCRAPSPAVLPALCAARPCRKSMACSAWVSNTRVTGVHAPTLVYSLTHTGTGATLIHLNLVIHTLLLACALTHVPERCSTQGKKDMSQETVQNIHIWTFLSFCNIDTLICQMTAWKHCTVTSKFHSQESILQKLPLITLTVAFPLHFSDKFKWCWISVPL